MIRLPRLKWTLCLLAQGFFLQISSQATGTSEKGDRRVLIC